MACLLCQWICNSDGKLAERRSAFWRRVERWEQSASNDWALWDEDSERNRALNEQAVALIATDPDSSLRLYLEAAEAGSAWALDALSEGYEFGRFGPPDLERAQEHYHRAICAGSWMATLGYARVLSKRGNHDLAEEVLQDGAAVDFLPACYWLAWHRFEQKPTRRTCRDVRPLMERAAEAGHPMARLMLARWMVLGKFGLREIPEGFRRIMKLPRFDTLAAQSDAGEAGEAGEVRQAGQTPSRALAA